MKKLLAVAVMVILLFGAVCIANGAERQIIHSLKDMNDVNIIVYDVDSSVGIFSNKLRDHIETNLKNHIPSLRITKDSDNIIFVRIIAIDAGNDVVTGNVATSVKRKLYLEDRKTPVQAGVRNYANIFFVSKSSASKKIVSLLNDQMKSLIAELKYVKKYHSAPEVRKRANQKKEQIRRQQLEPKKELWSN
ncbi:MAG: hypothetical protein JSV21_02155 [Nitrospirota bacterium]|nr:MAG: hypothetical protein JSV21_02155 [Nitrospirota bacterium]